MEWARNPTATPKFVRNVILTLQEAQDKGAEGGAEGKRALDALARAMGIVPSSEKTKKEKIPKTRPIEESELEGLQATEKEIKSLMRFVARQHKKIQARIKEALRRQSESKSETESKTASGPHEPILGGTLGGTCDAGSECFDSVGNGGLDLFSSSGCFGTV